MDEKCKKHIKSIAGIRTEKDADKKCLKNLIKNIENDSSKFYMSGREMQINPMFAFCDECFDADPNNLSKNGLKNLENRVENALRMLEMDYFIVDLVPNGDKILSESLNTIQKYAKKVEEYCKAFDVFGAIRLRLVEKDHFIIRLGLKKASNWDPEPVNFDDFIDFLCDIVGLKVA